MKKARLETNSSMRNSVTQIVPACTFFSEDIMIAIFTYLPLTSIYKFKSVSKVWLSILSDPYFIAKWFHSNNKNKSLPWMHYITSYYKQGLENYACPSSSFQFISRHDAGFSFRFLTNYKPVQGKKLNFVGSSNGLVLCFTLVNYKRTYYVCNPLTQKWVSVPSPPIAPYRHMGVIGFICEPSSSYTTSCYKVVCILSYAGKFYANIFCSNFGEWKRFQVSCPDNVSLVGPYDNVVTHDGVLYWINQGHKIIAYDFNNFRTGSYQCRIIDLPDEYGRSRQDRVLGESEGLICYARINRSRRTLSGWVLKEDNWQLLYDGIELDDIFFLAMDNRECTSHRLDSDKQLQLVGFDPADRQVVLLFCWNYIWEFNIRTRRLNELRYPSIFLANNISDMQTPFVLKPMPTILPPLRR